MKPAAFVIGLVVGFAAVWHLDAKPAVALAMGAVGLWLDLREE